MPRRTKKKPTRSTVSPPDSQSRAPSFLRILPLLICLMPAVFFFTFGKYLEFNQPGPFDSGAYVYSAKHLLEGARMGIDEIPSAEPGTLLANLLGVFFFGFNDIGPKIIQMLLQIGALTTLFFAARKLFGKTAAVLSVTIAAVYLSAPHIAKVGNVKEQYMIAFMIMGACCWIFYELSEKKRWLLLTGAALIWPYYFKATGLTIDIAFCLYFFGRSVLIRKPLKQFQVELGLLVGGALIGSLPLAAFFIWQRQLDVLLNGFPFLILKSVIALDVISLCLFFLVKMHPMTHLVQWGRQVRPGFWLAGLVLILLMLAGGSLYVHIESRGFVGSYLGSLFFIRIPYHFFLRLIFLYRTLMESAGSASAYISESRRIYSWSQQAPIVFRYYASLGVPVACALLSTLSALFLWVYRKLNKPSSHSPQDRLVWLLILWWLLDTAFVWISPRSYEQYYLPLCGSGAVLSGYAVWLFTSRMQRSPFPFPW